MKYQCLARLEFRLLSRRGFFRWSRKNNALHIEHMEAFSNEDPAEKDQARKPKDQVGEALVRRIRFDQTDNAKGDSSGLSQKSLLRLRDA